MKQFRASLFRLLAIAAGVGALYGLGILFRFATHTIPPYIDLPFMDAAPKVVPFVINPGLSFGESIIFNAMVGVPALVCIAAIGAVVFVLFGGAYTIMVWVATGRSGGAVTK